MPYECTTLQWSLDIRRSQEDRIQYYCAVYQGTILDIYELEGSPPFLSMANALNAGLIQLQRDGTHLVSGFHYRCLGFDELILTRIMLFGHIAPPDIRQQYLGTKVLDRNTQNTK